MIDIFLSYAEEDRQTAARVAKLLENSGWTVWWDRGIPAGAKWRAAIADALARTRALVVLWSRFSVASEWVNEESDQARRAGKLIPVRIDDVSPPLGFGEFQCADLTRWDGSEHAPSFRKLILDIEVHLCACPGADTSVAGEAAKPTGAVIVTGGASRQGAHAPATRPSWRLASGVVITLVCIAVTIAALRLWTLTGGISPAGRSDAPPASEVRLERPEPPPVVVEATVAPLSNDKQGGERETEQPAKKFDVESVGTDTKDKNRAKPPVRQSDAGTVMRSNERCANILSRLALGDAISDSDRQYLSKECR
ncbi:MAG: toll/interleukin-1 receptor domain-containing protein [Rhodospirillales bacterium]|nr:toll/interleukin-1 receptor domain-containing protein [Rhodospirillales bacterium]